MLRLGLSFKLVMSILNPLLDHINLLSDLHKNSKGFKLDDDDNDKGKRLLAFEKGEK